ncbi:MAG: hypothetical protein N3B21_13665 [Clostridia bacterium]|nr:hypothetical protein [Clostridia bacterium]
MERSVNRKVLNAVLIVIMVSVLFISGGMGLTPVSAFSGTGTGTVDDPYIITTVAQLAQINNDLSANYKLGNDIYIGNMDWTPIGNSTAPFGGVLDGNGYTINNIKTNRPTVDYIGLFGYIKNATIKNLNISTVDIKGRNYVGAIAGYSYGSVIEDCSLVSGVVSGTGYVGGLVGNLQATSSIIDTYSTVQVSGTGSYIGGLAGYSSYGRIMRSYTTGDVVGGTASLYVGGLEGYGQDGIIQDSFSLGNVTGKQHVGGILGSRAASSATVKLTQIKNSYAGGKITATTINVGGLSSITTDIISSYYDGVASGYAPKNPYDISRLTSSMTRKSNFAGWDFEAIWDINEGESYPYLRSLPRPVEVSEGLPTDDVSSGTGTIDDPYIISTPEQLNNVRYELTASYKLANDIDLASAEWMPIGSNTAPFEGFFDGNGSVISYLKIYKTTLDYIGLFGYSKDATIKNVNISGIDIKGKNYVGALVGQAYASTIQDCSIENGIVSGVGYVGGLVGNSQAATTITDTYSTAQVMGTGSNLGGLVGYNSYGRIVRCYTASDVLGSTTASLYVGGMVGYGQDGLIQDSFSLGKVDGKQYVGGLLGSRANSSTTVKLAQIKNSYAAVKLTASTTNKGGLSSMSTDIANSYFNSTTSVITTPTTQARTTVQMLQKNTFVGWDFNSVWMIEEGMTYPYLSNLPKPEILPDKPTLTLPDTFKITVTSINANSISLQWDAVGGVTGYDIEVDGIINDNDSSLTYKHDGLELGTQHTYRVRAKNDDGMSNWSNSLVVSTLLVQPSVSAPEDIGVEAKSTEIKLTWAPVEDATSYEIEVDGKLTNNGASTEFVHSDLIPGTTHIYKLRAKNEQVTSFWTPRMKVLTSLGDISNLEVPVNLTAIPSGTTMIVTWDSVTGAKEYEIDVNGQVYSTGASTNYIHKDVAPGTQHIYKVRAKNTAGTSNWSAAVTQVVPLGAIMNIKAVPTETNITVTWDSVIGAEGYDLLVDNAVVSDVTSPYVHENLIPGTVHSYKVRAKNSIVTGEWSTEIATCTYMGIPTNVVAEAEGNEITLTWDGIIGNVQYEIDVDGQIYTTGTNTIYVHRNLIPGTQHMYKVRAINSAAVGNWSTTVAEYVPIGKVTGISAAPAETSMTITWDIVTGAEGYDLLVDGIKKVNVTSPYVQEGLEPGTIHTYKVRAKNSAIEGEWSAELTRATLIGVPLNVVATASENEIIIAWDSVEGNVEYEVDVDGQIYTTGESTTYVHKNLTPGTKHIYKVRARNSAGTGNWSNAVIQLIPLGVVQNVNAAAGETTMTITWDSVAGAGGYNIIIDGIERNDVTSPYVHENLIPGTVHTYKVRARNSIVAGDWSTEITKATIIGVPLNVVARAAGNEMILSWDGVSGNVEYEIDADGQVYATGASTTYVHRSLTPGTQHIYKVRAKNSEGTGEWSNAVIQVIPLGVVQNVNAVAAETAITITWDSIPGAEGYDLIIDGIEKSSVTSPYIHQDLIPGTIHNYKVRAKNTLVTGEWSNEITKSTLIGIPLNIAAKAVGNEVTLTWEPVVGAVGYEIEVNGVAKGSVTTTKYIDRGLTAGTQYSYRVRAKGSMVSGNWSTMNSCWTVPEVPTNINTAVTETTMTISWSNVSGAISYDLEVNGRILENALSGYTISNLAPNTQNSIRVRARNAGGASEWSNTVKVTTLLSSPIIITAATTDSAITISWNGVDGAVDYDIEVDGIVKGNVTGVSYTHSPLVAGEQHTYRVRAKNAVVVSNWSAPVTKRTNPGKVTNLMAVPSATDIMLTWNAAAGATGYDIEVNGIIIGSSTATSYTNSGLAPMTQYTYRVRAKNESGVGEWSTQVIVKTLINNPANVNAIVTDKKIKVTWSPVPGATGYDIEVDGVLVDTGIETVYNHTQLNAGTQHTYRVRARNSESISSWSTPLSVWTLLDTPKHFDPEVTSTEVVITWAAVDGAMEYEVYVDGAAIPEIVTTPIYKHMGLPPGSQHTYKIRAKNANTISDWSRDINAKCKK